jgi:hypothetical protein
MPDQTSTSYETDQALRAAIVALLVAAGWTALERSTAIAMKTYDTAVGPKDAHVYLADFGRARPTTCCRASITARGRTCLARAAS